MGAAAPRSSPRNPKRDSRVLLTGSFTRPTTGTPTTLDPLSIRRQSTKSKFLHQIQLFLELRDSQFRRNIQIKLQIEVLLALSTGSPCQQKGILKFQQIQDGQSDCRLGEVWSGSGVINNVIEGDDEEKDDDATETQHDTQ